MTEEEIEEAIDSLQTEINNFGPIDQIDFQRRALKLMRELLKLHHTHYHTPAGIKYSA